jgi:murein DD-endopeptidase MepM/ murein hydrolase activator NlpD
MGRYIAGRRLRCTFFWGLSSVVAIGAAGCSGDMSRFGENPNGNSYARAPSYQQSAYQPPAAPIAPTRAAAVESQPLPQVQSAYSPAQSTYSPYAPQPASLQYEQPQYTPPPAPQYSSSQYASPASQYAPAQYAPSAQQFLPPQSVPPQPVPAYVPSAPRSTPDSMGPVRTGGNWDQGGGAKLAHAAQPRTSAAIPQVPATARAPTTSISPAPAQAALPMPTSVVGSSAQTLLPTPPVHTVASGDTLARVAHRYRVSAKEIAVANGITPETPLRVGTKLTIPVKVVARPSSTQPPQSSASVVAQAKPMTALHTYAPAAPVPGKLASSESAANVRLASPVEAPPAEAGPNGAPAFRWPARGRIINNFGARVNGSSNDGIDLAVPEGTQVRAADDGVVAYAGNELKGYGNLVLVRHSNGFVTAYANGSELLVKRNDQVHKGQVILKSGQTGNAATPQLHFEVRKNSAPVDPMQFLPADKTASAPL